MSGLGPEESARCDELLLQRGRVPHRAWPRIVEALHAFQAEDKARDAEASQGTLSFDGE